MKYIAALVFVLAFAGAVQAAGERQWLAFFRIAWATPFGLQVEELVSEKGWHDRKEDCQRTVDDQLNLIDRLVKEGKVPPIAYVMGVCIDRAAPGETL